MANETFPDQIYNGTHGGRPDISTVSAPDHADYLVLVREIRATQEYLLSLSKNSKVMPDLKKHLSQANVKLMALKRTLKTLTPPKNLSKSFKEFEETLAVLESQKNETKLSVKADLIAMQTTLETNQLSTLELQSDFVDNIKGFQNKLLNRLRVYEKEVSQRLDAIEAKITQVSVQAKIGNLLKQLDKD